jgi:hypothetical protein
MEPHLTESVETYEWGFKPAATAEQQARIDDISQRRETASRELYENDPSFFELAVDDIVYPFDQELTAAYNELG